MVCHEHAAAHRVAPSPATHIADRPVGGSRREEGFRHRSLAYGHDLFGARVACAFLAIVLESGWPVLYVQPRVGRGGRAFPVFKFGSMGMQR